ncbi:MMPL family transporter [Streptomyces sviceus]|uniref:MMPL family transporter n=1 Tax=Streptomyces sviceus TaxID=285530 RepID=UPI0036E0683C
MTQTNAAAGPREDASACGLSADPPFAFRHRRTITAVAGVCLVLAAFLGHGAERRVSPASPLPPRAPARLADETLARDFNGDAPGLIVLAETGAEGGVDAPAVTAAGRLVEQRLARQPGVERTQSYWTTESASLRSADGRSALVLAWLKGGDDEGARAADRLDRVIGERAGPLRLWMGGQAAGQAEVARQAARDASASELIALPVTVLLLVIAFASPLAATLTVLLGILAAACTTAALGALTRVGYVSVYALSVSTALAFALSVDYSLFVVHRYRHERSAGADTPTALDAALRTAGRTVAYSAATVACGSAVLLVFPHPVLRSIAVGAATATLTTALCSILVLPAVLSLLGDRIDRFTIRRWPRRGRADSQTPRAPAPRTPRWGSWQRFATAVMRRPLVSAVAASMFLLALALPFAQIQLGLFDDRVLPPGATTPHVTNALRAEYPSSPLNATQVVLPGFDAAARAGDLDAYARQISRIPGVTHVDTVTGTYRQGQREKTPTPALARFASAAGVYLSAATRGDPTSQANTERTARIRALPAPTRAWVTGHGARVLDTKGAMLQRLPLALTLVAAIMFAFVLAMTRRPVLAAKALVVNTLSLCATFGALVWVFQFGHLRWLIGDFTPTGTVDSLMPVIIFCIAFGVSMDYECMLLARIVEEHEAGADTPTAIVQGVSHTARLFTWSAALLAVVMAALTTSGLVFLKATGLSLALAALMDATLVRGVLAPAAMHLAGPANWWIPPLPRRTQSPNPPSGSPTATSHENPPCLPHQDLSTGPVAADCDRA